MATTIMTRNGQITVPKKIREKLRLTEGSRLSVTLENGSAVIRPTDDFPWERGESVLTDEAVAAIAQYREASGYRYA